MTRVLVIGAGKGGTSMLQFLKEEKYIEIVGVVDVDPLAPGIDLAEKLGFSTDQDFYHYLENGNIDIVIDVTGDPGVEEELRRRKDRRFEIMSGSCAKMMWALVDESERRHKAQKTLYDASKVLATTTDLPERLKKALGIILSRYPGVSAAVYMFDKNTLINCWQLRGCKQKKCPAHEGATSKCWSYMHDKKMRKPSGCAGCIVFLSASLMPVATCGLEGELARRGRISIGHFDLAKPLIEKTSAVHSRLSSKNQLFKFQEKPLVFKSQVVFPLTIGEEVNGIFCIASAKKEAFDDAALRSFSALSDDIAMAIERYELKQGLNERLVEHRLLCEIGIALTTEDNIPQLFSLIVHTALKLTGCPAGSLAIYRQETGEFELAASSGFSQEFSRVCRWRRRAGGLTDYIIRHGHPVIIPDVSLHPTFDNPVLLREGIKSLISIPLISRNKVIGLLYADDFRPRNFSAQETAALSLLATQAAVAIEKAQLLKKTEELAIMDGLTGLYNYRYFHQRLEQELIRAKRYNLPLSLIFADLDFFKDYNDRFGHLKGDDVLRKIAQLLQASVRKVDFVARYGGEEFALILPETDEGKAKIVSERIRESIENHYFPMEKRGGEHKLTISLGVVVYPHDGKTKLSLLKKADGALYKAKRTGRNRVCLYSLIRSSKAR